MSALSPKAHVRAGTIAVVLGFAGLAAGCDFSGAGLGATPAPAVDRTGGRPPGTGGKPAPVGMPAPAGTGGTPMVPPGPPVASPPTAPGPPMGTGGAAVDAGVTATGMPSRPDAAPEAPPAPPPPAARGDCPPGQAALLLCLRFESMVVDESEPIAPLNSESFEYVPGGPGGTALRLGPGRALRFERGVGALADRFTLEAWVRADELPTGSARMGVLDKENHFGVFVLPGGDLVCSAFGIAATARFAITAGKWTAVACTLEDGAIAVYTDGVRRASLRLPAGATAAMPAIPNIIVGGNYPSGDNFGGLIDNVRIWNLPRSAADLCQSALPTVDCR